MANKVVSNTGPIIHLSEINFLVALTSFSTILIPQEVNSELKKNKIFLPSKIRVVSLKNEWKDFVKVLTNQHNLDLGEAEAISLFLQEKANYFFTDDLDAREIAKYYNVSVHGTVGLVLRALKEKIVKKKEAVEKIKELQTKSSLFITKDLIEEILEAIDKFK